MPHQVKISQTAIKSKGMGNKKERVTFMVTPSLQKETRKEGEYYFFIRRQVIFSFFLELST